MATHSSVLAWRIPGTAEPGGLPSMGSHRVGHDWSNSAAAAASEDIAAEFGHLWVISTFLPLAAGATLRSAFTVKWIWTLRHLLLGLIGKRNRKVKRKGIFSSLVISANSLTHAHVYARMCLQVVLFLLQSTPSVSHVDHLPFCPRTSPLSITEAHSWTQKIVELSVLPQHQPLMGVKTRADD